MNVTFHYTNIELYEYEYTSITLEKKHSEKHLPIFAELKVSLD